MPKKVKFEETVERISYSPCVATQVIQEVIEEPIRCPVSRIGKLESVSSVLLTYAREYVCRFALSDFDIDFYGFRVVPRIHRYLVWKDEKTVERLDGSRREVKSLHVQSEATSEATAVQGNR